MEMDAGVALTAAAIGGLGAGGLGARCLVDLLGAGAGGWGSAASGSLEVTEVSWRKMIKFTVGVFSITDPVGGHLEEGGGCTASA